jgi:hypothetical protein
MALSLENIGPFAPMPRGDVVVRGRILHGQLFHGHGLGRGDDLRRASALSGVSWDVRLGSGREDQLVLADIGEIYEFPGQAVQEGAVRAIG